MRTQGKHAGLRREHVLDTAVALIDDEGSGALSMRRLAGELGIEAMTLYHHFRNKNALEDAIVEHVLASQEDPAQPDRTHWQELVSDYALMFHRALIAHPGIVPLVATRPAMTERNVRKIEVLLTALTASGFSAADSLNIVHTAAATVLGLHITRPGDAQDAVAPEPGATPLLHEAMEQGAGALDARIEFAIRTLIAGLESRR